MNYFISYTCYAGHSNNDRVYGSAEYEGPITDLAQIQKIEKKLEEDLKKYNPDKKYYGVSILNWQRFDKQDSKEPITNRFTNLEG